VVAAAVSLTVWYATMATAPRYSRPPNSDTGNAILFPILLGAAVVGGLVVPRKATVVGVWLVLPALLWSPWTTPRGDNDGLWLLIVPMLAFLTALTVVTARGVALVRTGQVRARVNSVVDDVRDAARSDRDRLSRARTAVRRRVGKDREEWRAMKEWERTHRKGD
jgi:hypothetical protein